MYLKQEVHCKVKIYTSLLGTENTSAKVFIIVWRLVQHEPKDHETVSMDFSDSSVSKESMCNAGDRGSIPVSGRFPGEGNGNPFQYSGLGNPMDRRAWMAINHGVSRVGNSIVTKPPPPLATKRLPSQHSGKESACRCRRHKRQRFDP